MRFETAAHARAASSRAGRCAGAPAVARRPRACARSSRAACASSSASTPSRGDVFAQRPDAAHARLGARWRAARCCRDGAAPCRPLMTPDEYCAQQGGAERLELPLQLPAAAAGAARRDHRALRVLPRSRRRRRRSLRSGRRARQARVVAHRDRRRSTPARRSIRSRSRCVPVVRRFGCRRRSCRRSSTACRWTSSRSAISISPTLETYCHRVAGVVGLLSARDLRLRGSRDARLCARPRHRVPADQHHPRRRRGRAARPHLPAAGRARALRRGGIGRAARAMRRPRFVALMALPGRSRARMVRPRAWQAAAHATGARSARASRWRRSTARCSTRSSATAIACSTGASR